MPALATSRQPGNCPWFSGRAGRALLEAERRWIVPALAVRPSRPYLWLSPVAQGDAGEPAPSRRIDLHPEGQVFSGSLRCGLPLPLPGECLGDVVLQHPDGARLDDLLDEAARVLVDGGRLWLCAFNRFSPFGLGARPPRACVEPAIGWAARLQRLGMRQVEPVSYLGPRWRPGADAGCSRSAFSLRGACVVQAEKRSPAPASPAPVQWRRGTAQAG